jgi:cytochrome c oxidase subunit 4
MTHASPSWIRYLVVWLALLALTGLSFLLSLAHLGPTDVAVALAIALAKTSLVGLFFMHLVEERFSMFMVPVVATTLVLLLLGLLVTDVATRRTFPKGVVPSVDAPGMVE